MPFVLAALLAGPDAPVRPARCDIWMRNAVAYDGPCDFTLGRRGSFALDFPARATDIALKRVGRIEVRIVEAGVAEVRDSRGVWGRAERQQGDPACWQGSDFRVCAY